MNLQIKTALMPGMVATAAFTIVTMIAPMMGFPKMSPPEMLSSMFGFSIAIGWIMHIMIGLIYAVAYLMFFQKALSKISNKFLKGMIFGMVIFVFAQVMMALMGMIFSMPQPEGSMLLNIIGSFMGHIIFGLVIILLVKE